MSKANATTTGVTTARDRFLLNLPVRYPAYVQVDAIFLAAECSVESLNRVGYFAFR